MNSIRKYLTIGFLLFLCTGCFNEFLEEKSKKSLLVPKKISDLAALLDNATYIMNVGSSFALLSDGDLHVSDPEINVMQIVYRNAYLWKKDIFESSSAYDWDRMYQKIFYSNVVLEGLEKITPTSSEKEEYKRVKGSALFFRAHAFITLTEQYTAPYNSEKVDKMLGVPLKLISDVNNHVGRSTLKQIHDQILADLNQAIDLLPTTIALKSRPSRAAVYAVLARFYLCRQEYENAFKYAEESLKINSKLLDYNTVAHVSGNPFPAPFLGEGNPEIYYSGILPINVASNPNYTVNPELVKLYKEGDLRKDHFIASNGVFKGTYSVNTITFCGPTTAEMFLIKAESSARKGDLKNAALALETLLLKRYKDAKLFDVNFENQQEALRYIILERRKELLMRGIYWTDLRRLNTEPEFARDLTRTYNGETYTLPANDLRYTFPIPLDEIAITGIEQNLR